MIAVNPAQRVGNDADVVAAALRETADAAELEALRDDGDLRKSDGRGDAAVDAVGGGAQRVVGGEDDVNAVERRRALH